MSERAPEVEVRTVEALDSGWPARTASSSARRRPTWWTATARCGSSSRSWPGSGARPSCARGRSRAAHRRGGAAVQGLAREGAGAARHGERGTDNSRPGGEARDSGSRLSRSNGRPPRATEGARRRPRRGGRKLTELEEALAADRGGRARRQAEKPGQAARGGAGGGASARRPRGRDRLASARPAKPSSGRPPPSAGPQRRRSASRRRRRSWRPRATPGSAEHAIAETVQRESETRDAAVAEEERATGLEQQIASSRRTWPMRLRRVSRRRQAGQLHSARAQARRDGAAGRDGGEGTGHAQARAVGAERLLAEEREKPPPPPEAWLADRLYELEQEATAREDAREQLHIRRSPVWRKPSARPPRSSRRSRARGQGDCRARGRPGRCRPGGGAASGRGRAAGAPRLRARVGSRAPAVSAGGASPGR